MTTRRDSRRTPGTLRAAACLAAALLAPVALVACSSGDTGKPVSQAGDPSGSGSPEEPQPSQTATESADPTPGETTAPGGEGTRCLAGQLTVTVEPGDSAAGQVGMNLVFVNTSAGPCTMRGYPGVSFVTGEAGQQVNDAATRAAGISVTTVTLAAGGAAHAVLRATRPGNFDESACRPVQVAGVRIYPPDDTASLFAASAQQACSAKGVGVPQISPVQPGRG